MKLKNMKKKIIGENDNLVRLEKLINERGSESTAHWHLPVILFAVIAIILGIGLIQVWPVLYSGINSFFSGLPQGLMAACLAALILAGSFGIGFGINWALGRRVNSQQHAQRIKQIYGSPKHLVYVSGSGSSGFWDALNKNIELAACNSLVLFLQPPLSAIKAGFLATLHYVAVLLPAKDAQGAKDPAMAARREEQKSTTESHDLYLNVIGGQNIRTESWYLHFGQGHTSETVTEVQAPILTAGRAGANVLRDVVLVKEYTASPVVENDDSEAVSAIPEVVQQVLSGVTRINAGDKGGSGIFIEDDLILTATHVVEGKTSVKVYFPANQEVIDAKIVEGNVETDIAILKLLDTPSLAEPLSLGNSDALCLGDQLIVMGYPDDGPASSDPKVKAGILAAKITEGQYTLLQTDAATNPGNSGGPLINDQGEVIGIVIKRAEKTADGKQIQGAGYAISSNDVKAILERFIG